jgi:hypothetical protein
LVFSVKGGTGTIGRARRSALTSRQRLVVPKADGRMTKAEQDSRQ